MDSKYRKVVFIVTYARTNKGIKYLILKRKSHWIGWEFSKGGINISESEESAVKRELFEETGKHQLKIKKFNFHGKYKYKKKISERKGIIGQSYSLYAVEIKYGKIKIEKLEHSDYKWLDFEEAVKKVTWSNQKESLRIVDNWLKNEEFKDSSKISCSLKKKINHREITLTKSKTKLLLGKDERNNDLLMERFEGKPNIIIHTQSPGSPFCVIENNLKPSKKEIYSSGVICAKYSQDWRDNKKDVMVHIFTGKDISKKRGMKPGTWEVKKLKKEKIKKNDIINFENKK